MTRILKLWGIIMKKSLLLITDHFPYDCSESFIEPEMRYLSESFDTIIICPLNAKKNIQRSIPHNCIIRDDLNIYIPFKIKILGFFYSFKAFWGEIIKGFPMSLNVRVFIRCLRLASAAGIKSRDIQNILKEYHVDIIYSYWLNLGALSAVLSNVKIPIVSRVHGYDLYADRHLPKYVPFQRYLMCNVSRICPVSQAGCDYLACLYPKSAHKISLYRLGVENGSTSHRSKDGIFRIVSCSNLIPLKRVDIIASAIKKLTYPVEWIHFGSGPEQTKIENIIKGHLGGRSKLMGQVNNASILEYYENNPIDLFLTTSSTEGCPVSLMEAASRSIPVMATAVGGIPELITGEDFGVLLPADLSPEILVNEIDNLYYSRRLLQAYGENIYKVFYEKFNAKINFPKFINEVLLNGFITNTPE